MSAHYNDPSRDAYNDGKYGYNTGPSNDYNLNERYRWEEGYKERQAKNQAWEAPPSHDSSSSSSWSSQSYSTSDSASSSRGESNSGGLSMRATLILIVVSISVYKLYTNPYYLDLLISALVLSFCVGLATLLIFLLIRWRKNLSITPKISLRKNSVDYDLQKEKTKTRVFLKRMCIALIVADIILAFFHTSFIRFEIFYSRIPFFCILGVIIYFTREQIRKVRLDF